MARGPLFSSYRQGENRITSTMLAVFARLDLSDLEQIIGNAARDQSLQMVSFTNQPAGAGASVPDAVIRGSFGYWFETKTSRNALNAGQLRSHLACLTGAHTQERLFVITPDGDIPSAVPSIGDDRIIWFSFADLCSAIDQLLTDARTIVAEHNVFLLRDLQAMFAEDGLLDTDDVVVVAARVAYPDYLRYSAYICQPGRSFRQGLTHMGFYLAAAPSERAAIQPQIPKILDRRSDVLLSRKDAGVLKASANPKDIAISTLIDQILDDGSRTEGERYQVFVLSPPDDTAQTVVLPAPVVNSGKGAWTQGQRYTRLATLQKGVTSTGDLG
jgi:hypothetical protein